MGAAAEYQFRLGKRADEADETQASVLWTHDALGRRVSETVCGAAGAVVSKTLYVWDGWRLVAELDARENNRVVAEYVPGPGYVDETVAVRRDLNRDGDFADANEGFLYPLADQQHSTVALLNASGAVVERYGYDAFGTPSFYDGAGNALAGGSAVGNTTLYTGRTWLPALGLYDYRQRLYDPAVGRFLTPDPAQDPANLGNPYTYTANNPHAFVDPYGEERWGEQSYFADVLDVGYGYFVGGPVDLVGGLASAVAHPVQTAKGLGTLAGGLAAHPLRTTGGLLGAFYTQFEDSDTAGQATFGAAAVAAPPIVAATKTAAATTGYGAIAATRVTQAAAATRIGAVQQAAIRARLVANHNALRAANEASRFDVHLAVEAVYANANKAVAVAREAGLTNRHGAFGMRAHQEFARLNEAAKARLASRGIDLKTEPFVDMSGEIVAPHFRGSRSVDALVSYRGRSVLGFDLKTGRPWSRPELLERITRFAAPLRQIQY